MMRKRTVYLHSRLTHHYNIISAWIQWAFYNGCSRVLKFVKISGVYGHTGNKRSKQLVLTEELFTDGVVNNNKMYFI